MKFSVEGFVARKGIKKFKIEAEASNEKHAAALVITKIGSKQGVKKNAIRIESVNKVD
ncbi:50S ribosomal protein L18Ae [Candidatus Marsarchaeota archaeon]|jgi:ribosomal protein L20A (L18A)|nr:50S ribosomal protein L18Ae [Candidatus Marsarchaeota archaeon]MCL5092562.1 50S ribosomal protein L18Ae [Candidatus Marsarchaeota archaeon]